MTFLVQELTGAGMIRDSLRGGLTAEVFRDLAGVEALWRGLEAGPDAVMTPYQRFDWVAAFVRAQIGEDPARQAETLRIMVLRDAAGRPQMLLPLCLAGRRGVRLAQVVGAKHANYHLPLYASRQAAALPADEVEAALTRAGRSAGIDVYVLDHQPRFWDGIANPLSARGRPCASDAYGLLLGPDPEATVKRAFSGDARKKLRAKERKLVEALGAVEHRVAATPGETGAILDAFYAQKRTRFADLGLPNPYADDGIRDFIARATAAGPRAGAAPAIEVHALTAVGGRVLATFAGAVDHQRFSGMWTSFDTDPETARFSPGDILLNRLVAWQTAAGRRALDLGVGEARYKSSICDETVALVEVVIPVTTRGQLFALVVNAAGRAKRRIKRSPRLWQAVGRVRRLFGI